MSHRNTRRRGLTLEMMEGRLAPSGGLGGHGAVSHSAAEVQHRRAVEDKPQHHAAGDNHAAAAHDARDDHGGGKKGGRDDGPAHR